MLSSAKPNPFLISALARAFLAGEPSVEAIVVRSSHVLGRSWRWLRPLAQRYLYTWTGRTRPRHREVVRFLQNDEGFQLACLRHARNLSINQYLTEPLRMQPSEAATVWNVPTIESPTALADWLQISFEDLEWFADLKGLERRPKISSRLSHYHYRVFTKRSGSLRLVESPKLRLKQLQRHTLARLLDAIPTHSAVHGFRKGRSIRTFAASHAGQQVVLNMDLKDFFPSVSRTRVQALFRTAGYPEPVADLIGGICTNAVPKSIWNDLNIEPPAIREMRDLYAQPHLPQGAPTSPALANLCAWRMDSRLSGLAKSFGAAYTRYADDLAFSGGEEFARRVHRLSPYVAAILHEEGFTANHHKTRIMRQGVRQQLTGLVINQHPNIKRKDFDLLKAILTNCIRLGPYSQNREDHPDFKRHLDGRISFSEMINPEKAKRLRTLFEQIEWE